MINQYSTSKQEQQQRKLVRANPFEPTEVDCQDTTKRFNALKLELKHSLDLEIDLEKSSSIPIAVSVELEFKCYLHTVHYGKADLGTYCTNSDTGFWEAYPIYSNPLDLRTYHKTSTEARSAIVSAYLKQPVNLPSVAKVRYLVSLCTEEVDEYGVPWGHDEIVELEGDVRIDWHLWLIRYSEQLGEDLRLLNVKKLENKTLTEF